MVSSKQFEFFGDEIPKCSIDDAQYVEVLSYVEAMKAVSRLSYRSFYIIDHYKRCFLYVSSGSLFLAGYNVEEVRNMGYDFYVRTLQPAELARISVINRLGFKFLHLLSEEERTEYTLAYHFRMFSKDGESIQVSHQLTPFVLLLMDEYGCLYVRSLYQL